MKEPFEPLSDLRFKVSDLEAGFLVALASRRWCSKFLAEKYLMGMGGGGQVTCFILTFSFWPKIRR